MQDVHVSGYSLLTTAAIKKGNSLLLLLLLLLFPSMTHLCTYVLVRAGIRTAGQKRDMEKLRVNSKRRYTPSITVQGAKRFYELDEARVRKEDVELAGDEVSKIGALNFNVRTKSPSSYE